MLKARLRAGAAWHDACILNLSSRGLLLQTAAPPERGSYLEVRRGPHVIVARVVWTSDKRAGLLAQDRLPVEAIVAEVPAPARNDDTPVERRRAPRPTAIRHERSRERARAMEFAGLAIAGLLAASSGFVVVQEALDAPLARVSAALTARKG